MSWHALCRYLDVIIDLSRAAQMADFRPSRLALMARAPCPWRLTKDFDNPGCECVLSSSPPSSYI